jgi:hypothetical protein
VKQRVGRQRGTVEHEEVGRGLGHRTAKDAVTHGHTADVGSGLVDHPGEVISEAGGHTDTEHRGQLGRRSDARVHRIETDGGDADAHLTPSGVRFGNLSQLQYLGTSELLIDDGAAHMDLQQRQVMGVGLFNYNGSDGTESRMLV